MLPFLARAIDQVLTRWLAPQVRRPRGYRPPDTAPPDAPDLVAGPGPLLPRRTGEPDSHAPDTAWAFRVPSPVPTPWPRSRTLHGRVMGPADARAALVVLHGAYGEYAPCEMVGQAFTRHGFRVLIPAAPCHLERTPRGTASGAALFWSARAFVLGTAQWLAEVRGLIDGLRAQGIGRVGVLGFSFGSQIAGLAATLWPDLAFAALVAPVGHHYHSIVRSPAAGHLWPWMRRLPPVERALLDRWAPLYRRPVVDRLLFAITRFDRLQPTGLQRQWWEAWQRPPHREYPHGHISLYFAPALYRDLGAFALSLAAPPAGAAAAIPAGAGTGTG